MRAAQGSLEYLLILAAILAIAVVVVLIANTLLGTPSEATIVEQDKYNFAVNGWEVRGYDKPFEPADPATRPDSFVHDGAEYQYGGPGSAETVIGSLIGSDGTSYTVSVDDGGNYYIEGDYIMLDSNDCNADQTISGDYRLAGDMACPGDAIHFAADSDGSTLDCEGKTITAATSGGFGIWIKQNVEGITIANCVINVGEGDAILVDSNAHNTKIINNQITGGVNSLDGVYLSPAAGIEVTSNTVTDMDKGIETGGSVTAVLQGNTITSSDKTGLDLGVSDVITLENNMICGSSINDVKCMSGSTIINNGGNTIGSQEGCTGITVGGCS